MTRHKTYTTLALGDTVRIKAAGDVVGVVSEHLEHLDGSHRWGVDYWHGGEKRSVLCRVDELEVVEKAGRAQ